MDKKEEKGSVLRNPVHVPDEEGRQGGLAPEIGSRRISCSDSLSFLAAPVSFPLL